MKTMVVGIPPDYVYPGSFAEWSKNNTLGAANLGASLITNALLQHFDADYVDAFDDLPALRNQYDNCVLALATHLHPRRDIWWITNLVERLGLKTTVLSAGITDYDVHLGADYALHPSVQRLLDIVSAGSEWIGVRGHYSAALLHRKGYRKAVPIGCPSLYFGTGPTFTVNKPAAFARPLVVYQLTMARECPGFLQGLPLLGQDFQDEAVFTHALDDDNALQDWLRSQFADEAEFLAMRQTVAAGGRFSRSFAQWFAEIGAHDFIIGPRLHGCIAGLIQGIPTLMTPRDLRGREIAEFFKLPTASYSDLRELPLAELYQRTDFTRFNRLYPQRYANFIAFLNDNGLRHRHPAVEQGSYAFLAQDIAALCSVQAQTLADRDSARSQARGASSLALRARRRVAGLLRRLGA